VQRPISLSCLSDLLQNASTILNLCYSINAILIPVYASFST